MNLFPLRSLGILGLALSLSNSLVAQACATGDPIKPDTVEFTSKAGTATIFGFPQLVSPPYGQSPRIFLRKVVQGLQYEGIWPQGTTCAENANSKYSDGKANLTVAGYAYPITWTATLVPDHVVGSQIFYKATTSGHDSTGAAINILIVADGPIDGSVDAVTFSNGEVKALGSGGPYGVLAYSDNPFLAGGISPTPVSMLAAAITLNRVVHDFAKEYDANNNAGTTFIENKDNSVVYRASSGTFPLSSGGTPISFYGGIAYGGSVPSTPQITETAEQRAMNWQSPYCAFMGPAAGIGWGEISGAVTETLSKEHTPAMAEARALSGAVAGVSNVVYRTGWGGDILGSVQTFQFQQVHVKAVFGLSTQECCGGDYRVSVLYKVGDHLASNYGAVMKGFLETATFSPGGQYAFETDISIGKGPFSELGKDYVILGMEAVRSCAAGAPGDAGSELDSIHYHIELGRDGMGRTAGQIRLDSETMTGLYDPPTQVTQGYGWRVAPGPGGLTILRDAAGVVRQILAPQALFDIVKPSTWEMDISVYPLAQIGNPDAITKLYSPIGTPIVVHHMENPDRLATPFRSDRFRITELGGSGSKVTEFSADSTTAPSAWTLSQGNGLRKYVRQISVIGTDRIVTTTTLDASGNVSSKTVRTYRTFPWGEEVIRDVLDPDGAALTTQYDFYEDSAQTSSYTRLKQQINPSGSWERHTYDSSGRPWKTISPFLDAPATTTDESLCRVTERTYDTVTDLDGDGLADSLTTTVERTKGQETSRRFRVEWSKTVTVGTDVCKRRSDIVATVPGALWSAVANLATETLTYASGAYAGRERRVVNPDGTATVTTCSGVYALFTTVKVGQLNPSGDDIRDGRSTQTAMNPQGQVTSERIDDILSGLTLSFWFADTNYFDAFSRPTKLIYLDGTNVIRNYACCGLASEVDRMGVSTSYTYDALGRRITMTRQGITTVTGYDADGRVVSTKRIGSDSTEIVQSTNTYDLAGRLVSRTDAMGRVTRFAAVVDNGSGSRTLTLTIGADARPAIKGELTAAGVVGAAFSYAIDATNSPTSFNATGLPGGLAINPTSGVISGTPTTAATSTVTLSATNATGTQTVQLALTISAAGAAPIITSPSTAAATVNTAFSYQVAGTNSPTSFSASGLPSGLTINPATGLISGTPVAAGTVTVTLRATNGAGTGSRMLLLPVSAAITSSTAAWTSSGASFSYQIAANNSPTSYVATGLPAGLTLNTSTGLISGAPSVSGAFTVSLSSATVTGSGQTTRTTTNPDGGTVIEISSRDGSRSSIAGTATAPHTYSYDVESNTLVTKDIAVGAGASGLPTATEWVKTYADFVGRSLKTVYADNATVQSDYHDSGNGKGKLKRLVDADGVTTLYDYNARGDQEVVALDLNRNGIIDYAGTDRITKITTTVVPKVVGASSVTVQQTKTEVWETDSSNTTTVVSISEQPAAQLVTGFRSWQTLRGQTTYTDTVLGSGFRTVTTTTPDSVLSVQTFDGDRLVSTVLKTSAEVELAHNFYSYDYHGRLQTVIDYRTAAATDYTYYDDDQIKSITTPDPDTTRSGAGYDRQTTTYTYDDAGRLFTVTRPDATVVTTTYWPTGQTKRVSGSRTYPVEYTYDPQGRVKTLKTWRDFSHDAGAAVTTWNYDPLRGFILNKQYADNPNATPGPSYTYYPSGRLWTRTWARSQSLKTIYTYNFAGDQEKTDYDDLTTPDVTVLYDRLGRPKTIGDGSGSRILAYHTSGQLGEETYTQGLLNGFALNHGFDSLYRPSSLGLAPAGLSYAVTYGYNASTGRLETVTRGADVATYGYLAKSPLVETVTFKNSGTTRLTTTKSYDAINRLASVASVPSSASTLSYTYAYNSANQRTQVTREDSAYWSYDYDALGQVKYARKSIDGGTAVPGHDFAWAYDDIGNRKTARVNGVTASYVANALNQYDQRSVPDAIDVLGAASTGSTVTVTVNSGTPQPTARQGELFYRQVQVSNASAAQYPTLKITGVKNGVGPNGEDAVTEAPQSSYLPRTPETFTHDADGNLTNDAWWQYTWDSENRLVAMETATVASTVGVPRRKLEFTYDGLGRRVAKKVSNWSGNAWTLASHTLFLYDGWNMIAEANALSGNAAIRTYVWGLDSSGSGQGAGGVGGLLSVNDALTSSTHFAAYDGNGNVASLVGATSGVYTAKYDYTVFGESILTEGSFSGNNPFRFSTKYCDAETGNFCYGLRYYQPQTGRWLSRDPIDEEGGTNIYAFVSNNGANAFDPVGLSERSVNFVGKSFINGVGSLGTLGYRRGLPTPVSVEVDGVDISGAGQYADERLKLFAQFAGKLDAFNQYPESDAKDGQYRLYGKVLVTAKCCGSFLVSYSVDTDKEGGREGPGISGTINLDTSTSRSLHGVKVKWKTWGRPNTFAEPGMQWVALRTSANIWHEGVVEVACSDGEPTFNVVSFRGSRFPSRQLYRDGTQIMDIAQGSFSDLWRASSFFSPTFVAP